jgi:hypothetical protein
MLLYDCHNTRILRVTPLLPFRNKSIVPRHHYACLMFNKCLIEYHGKGALKENVVWSPYYIPSSSKVGVLRDSPQDFWLQTENLLTFSSISSWCVAFWQFVVFQDLRCLLRMCQLLLKTSQWPPWPESWYQGQSTWHQVDPYDIYLGSSWSHFSGQGGDSRDSLTSFTALLASNLLAQFSRQIAIQILVLESPKFVGNSQYVHFSQLTDWAMCHLHVKKTTFEVEKTTFQPTFGSSFVSQTTLSVNWYMNTIWTPFLHLGLVQSSNILTRYVTRTFYDQGTKLFLKYRTSRAEGFTIKVECSGVHCMLQ